MIHNLKCWPPSFRKVVAGQKPFEVRKNDRGFDVGDILALWCWRPDLSLPTGWVTSVTVTSIVQGVHGLPADVCVLGFHPEEAESSARVDIGRTMEVFGDARPSISQIVILSQDRP